MSREDKRREKEERKEKIRERYVGVDPSLLETIPPEDTEAEVPLIQKKNLRVAAYVRVSTDDENQTSSYELQINHYKDFVAQHEGWELVGIYADEGISGTSIEHRVEFNRLIKDCEDGGIDLIITKSISRFARNTVDSLVTQRKLSNLKHPVGVFFETENLNSLEKGNDIIMTVLSATAQEESHVKSEIMVQSLKNRFNRGIFLTPELLGYDRDEDGNLVVNEDEADTVRLIYYLCLSGFSLSEIADTLTAIGRETKIGNTTWSVSSIRDILQNERYCGDIISWKTYTYDYLEHKSKKNRGARPRIRQTDHHEAIVSHEEWEAVQKMFANYKQIGDNKSFPVLQVVNGGALRGFVPVNRTWTGFSEEDYMNASQSAYTDDDSSGEAEGTSVSVEDCVFEDISAPEVVSASGEAGVFDRGYSSEKARAGDFRSAFSGFQVVSNRLFSTAREPALTIAGDMLRVNTPCLKKFQDVEYVELLLNTVEKCLAIRPCDKDNPNAIRWGRLKEDGRWLVLPKNCRGIAEPLYRFMGWDSDCEYRMVGQYFEDNGEKVLFFEMNEPEILKRVDAGDDGDRREAVPTGDDDGSREAEPPGDHGDSTETVPTDDGDSREAVPSGDREAESMDDADTAPAVSRKKIIRMCSPEFDVRYGDDVGEVNGDDVGEIHFLQRVECEGNWEILRPADSVEGIQEFNDAQIRGFTDKAQELIDKMRGEKNE